MPARVFFKNFPPEMTEKAIREVFSTMGRVVEIVLLKDKQRQTFNGMGFVTMANEKAAQAAINRLNGQQIEDREVLVEKAIEDPHRQLIDRIATTLGETRKSPINQIKRIVHGAGLEFAEKMLEETLAVEAQGGLTQADGERRTPGGVFFYLTRQALSPEQIAEIFPSPDAKKKHRKPTASQKQPPIPSVKRPKPRPKHEN